MHPNVKRSEKWAIEKPKLDNARRSRGIYFDDPKDEEFKDVMRNARRKLEVPMPAAMPCKTPVKIPMCQSSRETCRNIGKHKTKYACVVEVDESMRIRMEAARGSPANDEHTCGLLQYNLYGTRDAAQHWEDELASTLSNLKLTRGIACSMCVWQSCIKGEQVCGNVHGNDITIGG